MSTLDAVFLGGPSTPRRRMAVPRPDTEPEAPDLLHDPHGLGRVWQRISDEHDRPALYIRVA